MPSDGQVLVCSCADRAGEPMRWSKSEIVCVNWTEVAHDSFQWNFYWDGEELSSCVTTGATKFNQRSFI